MGLAAHKDISTAQTLSPGLAVWPLGPAVAVDVSYTSDVAHVGLVLSRNGLFTDELELRCVEAQVTSDYVSGDFAKRELGPLLAALAGLPQLPRVVFVGAFVTLDPAGRPGLGARVHAAGYPAVVGVAKSPFRTAVHAIAATRGRSATRPLWVTSVGVGPRDAAAFVTEMPGPYRLPDALRLADRLARSNCQGT